MGDQELCKAVVTHVIAGASWVTCARPKSECDGQHQGAGNCIAHGPYLGKPFSFPQCPKWPECIKASGLATPQDYQDTVNPVSSTNPAKLGTWASSSWIEPEGRAEPVAEDKFPPHIEYNLSQIKRISDAEPTVVSASPVVAYKNRFGVTAPDCTYGCTKDQYNQQCNIHRPPAAAPQVKAGEPRPTTQEFWRKWQDSNGERHHTIDDWPIRLLNDFAAHSHQGEEREPKLPNHVIAAQPETALMEINRLQASVTELEGNLAEEKRNYLAAQDLYAKWQAEADADLAILRKERDEIMQKLCITFDAELAAEDGDAYEVPAEPEPLYFDTLPKAIGNYMAIVEKECDRAEAEAAGLREALDWIDVKDKLPHDGENVSVLISDESVAIEDWPTNGYIIGKQWWCGVPGHYVLCEKENWTVKKWRKLNPEAALQPKAERPCEENK